MTVDVLRSTASAVRIPRGVFTLAKFRRWAASKSFPKRGRLSFLAGEVLIDMSPEEIESHNHVKHEISRVLGNFARETGLGDVLNEGVLLVNAAAGIGTEPDVIFSTWDSLRSGRVTYRKARKGNFRFVEVVGTPDLVLEVVSRSSVGKDKKRLPKLYHAAGIPEYWLIDARRQRLEFTLNVRGADQYLPAAPEGEGFVFSPVLQRHVRLTRGRNPVGGWRYDLLLR